MINPVITKIVRVGNSLAVVVPKHLLRQLNIQRGDTIVFGAFSDGQFSVRRLSEAELCELVPREIIS